MARADCSHMEMLAQWAKSFIVYGKKGMWTFA